MKCPNHLCQHGIEGAPGACPKCGIPLPGAVLADRFSLEKIARVTPFAITFAAFDRDRTAEAQVRVYIPRFGRRAANLKSEIKALKELQFEQLPRIFHLNWETDFPWVAEEKVQGGSLVGRLIGRERPFSEPEAVQVMLDAARILEKLHTLHIYHRDIRPETLYNRDTDNRLMLGTPGWDREFQEKPAAKNRPVYLAPEAGGGRATPQADLYALGVTALHLLTGLNPEGLYNAATRSFQWQRAVKVSPRLAEIVDGLVADAPGDRIQSAGRLVQLLSSLDRDQAAAQADLKGGEEAKPSAKAAAVSPAAASGVAVSIEPPAGKEAWGGLRTFEPPPTRRERKLKALLAAMAAAIAGLIGVIAGLWQRLLQTSFGQAVGAQGAKIIVALGLATGTATLAAALNDKRPTDRPASASAADRGSRLPEPLIGYDDRAITPVEPDAAAIAAAQGLPDPSLLGQWAR
ncbi:MAG: protein kinase, partial [Candidatus Sericytochromatia bacterium]|nr:protein kinase [Candidatus Tanganyikabacteria bacterium]